MPSPCKSGALCQQRQVLLEANESRENRNLKPWTVMEIVAYFLALQKSLALFGAAPKCSTLGNGDMPGCCLADNGVPWPLAGLAIEPRLKRAKLEVIHETLPAPLPRWWLRVEVVWGILIFVLLWRSEVWKQRHSIHTPWPCVALRIAVTDFGTCSLFVLMCFNFVSYELVRLQTVYLTVSLSLLVCKMPILPVCCEC